MEIQLKALRTVVAAGVLALASTAMFAQHYTQTNLASDLTSFDGKPVPVQNANLKNSWGLARSPGTPWWVNNGDTGTAILFGGSNGAVVAPPSPITIPNAPNAKGPSTPTGMIFNGTTDFMIRNVPGKSPAPAAFIFATEQGTISGWNPAVTPLQMAVNQVVESGAFFTGLTLIENGGTHFLLAANFAQNRVEEFDTNFSRVTLAAGLFADDALPADFAPYNVQAVGADVVVTYAHQNASKTDADDNCGDQCGFVDVYSLQGRLLQRFEHPDGKLVGPWGVALAPQDFGFFSHALLIGNRFSGHIDAFSLANGGYLGNLQAASGGSLSIPGLWALEFDNRPPNQANPSPGPALFFAAGINNYADGLVGTITPVAAEFFAGDHE